MPPDTDSTTDTNRPGRPRQHPDSAARTRAWRERRRTEAVVEAPPGPELALASLSVTLDQLRQVATGELATLAERIEGAIASLADPAQVEEALAKGLYAMKRGACSGGVPLHRSHT